MLSNEGQISFWNAAAERLFGYLAEEVINRSTDFLASKGSGDSPDLAKALRSGKTLGSFETTVRTKNGSPLQVSATVSVVRDKNDKPIASAAILRDVSELRETRDQLVQAQKMEATGRIAGGIAHDFNNLLAIIMGNAELIRSSDDRQDIEALVSEVVEASERGAELTRRLLSFARKSQLSPEVVNANQVVSSMSDIFSRVIPKSVAIDMDLAPDLDQTSVDVSFLEGALLNLVINARDALQDAGQLSIKTENTVISSSKKNAHGECIPAGDYVMISVTDTGVGIRQDDLPRVVEPFFTTKSPDRGSGLGLAMARGFARQSSGTLRI